MTTEDRLSTISTSVWAAKSGLNRASANGAPTAITTAPAAEIAKLASDSRPTRRCAPTRSPAWKWAAIIGMLTVSIAALGRLTSVA